MNNKLLYLIIGLIVLNFGYSIYQQKKIDALQTELKTVKKEVKKINTNTSKIESDTQKLKTGIDDIMYALRIMSY